MEVGGVWLWWMVRWRGRRKRMEDGGGGRGWGERKRRRMERGGWREEGTTHCNARLLRCNMPPRGYALISPASDAMFFHVEYHCFIARDIFVFIYKII